MKVMTPAAPKEVSTENNTEPLFEVSMNKLNTQITLGDI
jgi:hypothetical protein